MLFTKLFAVTCLSLCPVSSFSLPQTNTPTCTAATRQTILEGIPNGFNAVAPGASAAFIASLPLIPSCSLTLFINGLPGLQVAPDASTTRNSALLVRQAFLRVTPSVPASVDSGNGTTRSELEIDTGLLHTIALPVTFHAGLVFNYLDNCTIESVVGILTVPTSVLGIPILMPDVVAAVQELASQAAAMS
ncbi:hypothetical protein CLAFUW4_04449 [Fulvia fulva]|uniref:Uncharacterized protein n=1 Tax=Passalora fulva TaxID=5499 RepID=A0A9Q8P8C4_PASFU|nr:uncharacterized protein CLAFUR5_04413 [Fulvia fulva]KAK4626562.1 hypothetical protein CLAFUR4_04435 [Fulvia fulva]KAK4628397.1 hypothetical protein CLAFUR0_04438 [Fulvia fulva]UJO17085.1 hypothetical protein CLAFUR5_04413 [Fulvia fulva]WPV13466.1 hypothetical protein CLAFUW4_04449 [Fulvia fulva]WPV28206.1 hypothetical protein CLAFUW7_04440 [Fulvia fulva]